MRWETHKFIMKHGKKLLYDNAATGGNDNTTDAGAAGINPESYLAPVIGSGNSLIKILVVIALVVGIIYFTKNIFKQ